MTDQVRDRLAAAIAVAALLLGVGALAFGRFDPGVRLAQSNDLVVVTQVHERSVARAVGFAPGMVAVQLNGVELIQLPRYVFPRGFEDGYDPESGEPVEPIGIEPSRPTPRPLSHDDFERLLANGIRSLMVMPASALQGTSPDQEVSTSIYDDGRSRLDDSALGVLFGVLLLFGAWWVLVPGGTAPGLRPLAVPLAVAIAVPFLLRPLEATSSPPLVGLFGMAMPLAMIPLADGLLERIADPAGRRVVRWAAVACIGGAVVVGFALASVPTGSATNLAWWGLIGGSVLLPGLAAAGPLPVDGGAHSGSAAGRLLESAEFAVAGATPGIALGSSSQYGILPMILWVVLIVLAGRLTIRPLARLATRAALQRDLVVAATEAERARVAADIHDDALQELSMLVRRLDAAGDADSAEIARQVADRLRAICGDLRLPILDDLGVGPALDWLVVRIERLAGGEVRLERNDGTRPPADVELAFFRVAQEALANAVKHGRPPIVVRYHATPAGASLSIDDAGPGITPEAPAAAEREGRFGLLNMQQRAEQIGAILDVRRWPTGGTHVALEWRPR